MQSQGSQLGGERDTEDGAELYRLSQHEVDQEYLYRLWKAGKISETYVQSWALALSELEKESPCEYFLWLLKLNPQLNNAF